MPTYLLGTDNGCTMSKAAIFTPDGEQVAVASCKTETITFPGKPSFFERDIPEMWRSTAQAIKEVIEKSGIDPADIACVASAGHGNGIYIIDEDGEPCDNAIMSTDGRARDIIDEWTAAGVAETVLPKSMQAIWPAQPGALLLWYKRNKPEVLDKAAHVLMAKDYVRYKLTGLIQAEVTDMSGTGLLNNATIEYDDELLAQYGIEDLRRLLPPLVRTADIVGSVTATAAAETGLKEGTPVAGGMFDIDACGLSSGINDESQLCMIAGTWGNNQYISKTPVVSTDVFITSCYSIPGYYLMLEGSATSASNLEWFVTEFFAAEKKLAEEQGRSVYDVCNEAVGATQPEDSNIVFLPFLYGSNVNPDAKGTFVGLNGMHTRGHVLRAIYEGVVFGHKMHIDKLLKFRTMPDTIRLTGGAARSRQWVEIFADIFQTRVETPDATEAGALGACIAAAVAVGVHPSYDAAIDAMVRFSTCQEPNPARKELYEGKYANAKRVIEALDPVWTQLV